MQSPGQSRVKRGGTLGFSDCFGQRAESAKLVQGERRAKLAWTMPSRSQACATRKDLTEGNALVATCGFLHLRGTRALPSVNTFALTARDK